MPEEFTTADSASEEDYPPRGLAESVRRLPEWIQAGCGDGPYDCVEKNATFPSNLCPDRMPDISQLGNHMADALRKNPELYSRLNYKATVSGVTLAMCIKTGFDNPGHPHIKTVGMVAGDEDSYDLFKELFDPIIDARHGGYPPGAVHVTDLDLTKISTTDIDPLGKYVLTTRVRTGRSIRGFRLPPCIGFGERRELETVAVKALLKMTGELKGDYYPLHGSRSYMAKPGGMAKVKEEELRRVGNIFQEPDSTLLLASGMGRHWPDGRGIFHNEAKNLFVWLNEEDHLRIVSMQGSRDRPTAAGKQIREVFARFVRSCNAVQKVLKAEGYDFMHNDHLGWILTCPSNLGTGLRIGSLIRLPRLSARKDWKSILAKMGLQARGTGGVDTASNNGTWDISNADRIGKGEVQICNILIEGAARLVRWESMLEEKRLEEKVESEILQVLSVPRTE